MRGLFRSGRSNKGLGSIEWGKCCKPAYHPPWYGRCYDKNIMYAFDKRGWVTCDAKYFLVGSGAGDVIDSIALKK